MRIKWRLALVFLGLTLSILVIFSASFYYLEYHAITQDQKATELKNLNKLASACRDTIIQGSPITAINFINILKQEPLVLSALCLNRDGRVVAHSDPRWIGSASPEAKTLLSIAAVDEKLRLATQERPILTLAEPVWVNSKKVAVAQIEYDFGRIRGEIQARLLRLMRRVLTVSSSIFALALVVAFALAASLSRPISQLVHATQQIAKGDLKQALPFHDRKDEFGELGLNFNLMAEKLAEVDGLKTAFLENMTHDMRAPLSALQGYIEMMQQGMSGPVNETQAENLQVMYRSAKTLQEFVADILDLTSLQGKTVLLEKKPCAVAPIIRSVVDLQKATAQKYELHLETDIPNNLPLVSVDPKQINRALTNLVYNAFKFTPKGGKVTVAASVADSGGVVVEVRDTGYGIPENKLKAVFDKFFQVTETRKFARQAGTGLGLTITQEIIHLHGGKIWVQSKLNAGTSFFFLLPAAQQITPSIQTDSRAL